VHLYSIGELARRTGLTVKTIRYYADRGLVGPARRNPAGHRLFEAGDVARLALVRTLRDLGLDLGTIRRLVDREVGLPEVAAVHAEALDTQIKTLRLRRAVLTAAARRGSTPEEMELMHRLARLSEDERRRLIGEFLAAAFGDLGAHPAFPGIAVSMTPELPDDPRPEQIEAWVELAELAQDPGFRAGMRDLSDRYAADSPAEVPRRDPVAMVRDLAGPAVAAGVATGTREAAVIVAAVRAACPGPRVTDYLRAASDPRRERYLDLLSVINGWPAPERTGPVLDWYLMASAEVPV
jgi:DNA-binding transcriptional MerR regulator